MNKLYLTTHTAREFLARLYNKATAPIKRLKDNLPLTL